MNKYLRLCLMLSPLLVLNAQALDLTFSTQSKKPITVTVNSRVITRVTDQETGQTNAVVIPKMYTLEIDKTKTATATPEGKVITFWAQTSDKKSKSKEYLIYMPMVDPSLGEANITVKVRGSKITFYSDDIEIEENQQAYIL